MNKSCNVCIYTDCKTERIECIFSFLLSDILGVSFFIEESFSLFSDYDGPKLNYSTKELDDVLQFVPHGLLNESHIVHQENLFDGLNDFESLSPNRQKITFSFDPFASAFYLVTRYEEYLSDSKDKFGRFPAEMSSAFQEGFLDRPIIDEWAYIIGCLLETKYVNFKVKPRSFQFLHTIDIDNAYAYKGKGWKRNIGGFLKSLLQGRFLDSIDRIKVMTDQIKDPYDTYGYLLKTCSDFPSQTIVFFLLGNYGPLDKNLPYNSPKLQKLIQGLSTVFSLGLHPSYASNQNLELLKVEYDRLKDAANSGVFRSRQHYLAFDLPATYDRLESIGITHEYSMGYPDKIGFRASTCTPFLFFNLIENKITKLLIHPFCVMDVTLKNYLNLNPEQAIDLICDIGERVNDVGGQFVSVWHNESLSNCREWSGWRIVFEKMLKYVEEKVEK